MKHKLRICVVLILTFLCCFGSVGTVFAQQTEDFYFTDTDRISDTEALQLNAMAKQVSDAHNCGVYMAIVDDMNEYGFQDAYDFAKNMYTELEMGYGVENCGILLVLSMAERDYALIAHGNKAHISFTDYGKEQLEKEFLDNFKENDWVGGFRDYITECDRYIKAAEAGNPIDYGPWQEFMDDWWIYTLISLAVSGIVLFILYRQMRTVAPASGAMNYLIPGSVEVHQQYDIFTHRTETRTLIETNSNSGRSGGTSIDSDGFSGHSGKF